MSEPRFLRPAHLQLVGGRLWAVDEVQPVAAVLDPDSGAVWQLVPWAQLPAAAEHQWRGEWQVLSDGSCLWVQDIDSSPDAPPPDGGWTQLLAAGPDGTVRPVTGEHPLHDLVGTEERVALAVDTGRGHGRDLGAVGGVLDL